MRLGPDGCVYGCTFPGAKVVFYDPVRDTITSLGRMHPTEQYCSDVGVADNGRVFAGIGTHADLVVYDRQTGEKKSILPDRYKDRSFCDVSVEGNLAYASVDSIVLLIYDADTLEILMEVTAPPGGGIGTHTQISGGPIIIHGLPGGNCRFNRTTLQLEPYFTPKYSAYDGQTGIAYNKAGGRQIFQAYNLTSGELLSEVDISNEGDGMDVFSLGTGPDGRIYGGVVSLLKLFRYDPYTSVLEDMGFPVVGQGGEFYSFHTCDGKLYMASYSDAYLTVYDPTKPWSTGTSPESNPRTIGSFGHEQNRPLAITSAADGKIYVGTVPSYGKMGGALCVYDPATDRKVVYRNIVSNQSIVSLTTGADGFTVYGGTSISGGEGTQPVERYPHFFAWDVRQEKLTVDIVWTGGTTDIKSLVTAPDGRVYGCAGSTLFIFDGESGQIVHKQGAPGEIWRMVEGADGLIYCISQSYIFRFEPQAEPGETIGFETLHRGGRTMALDHDGRIYFGVGPDLYVLDNLPGFEEPTQDLVIYLDGLGPGWSLNASGANVDLAFPECAPSGVCQSVTLDRLCTLKYQPPDPWNITLWKYGYLKISLNPGNATLRDVVVGKSGSGSTGSISLTKIPGIVLEPGTWTSFEIPVQDLGWRFGSRLESLNLAVVGSGTFFLGSMMIAVPERWLIASVPFLVCFSLLRRTNPRAQGRLKHRSGTQHIFVCQPWEDP